VSRRQERERVEAEKHRRRDSKAPWAVLIVAVLVFLAAGFACVRVISQRSAGEREYAALAVFAPGEAEQAAIREKLQSAVTMADPQSEPLNLPLMNFDALQRENEDAWGWLCIFDTDVSLPVVSGSLDYTRQTFSGRENHAGCPFLSPYQQYGDGFHTVIYATPAARELNRYRRTAFRDEHTLGVLYTKEKTYALQAIAAYETTSGSGYDQVAFTDEADKNRYFAWLQTQDEACTATERARVGSLLTVSVPKGRKLIAIVFEMTE